MRTFLALLLLASLVGCATHDVPKELTLSPANVVPKGLYVRLDELDGMQNVYISPKAIHVFTGDGSACIDMKYYITPTVTVENTVEVDVGFRGGVTVTASRDEAYKFQVLSRPSTDFNFGDVKWVDLMVVSD